MLRPSSGGHASTVPRLSRHARAARAAPAIDARSHVTDHIMPIDGGWTDASRSATLESKRVLNPANYCMQPLARRTKRAAADASR